MESTRYLVRDTDAGDAIELLLVSAVGTVLVIRWFLAMLAYPKISGGGLHIGHMLWGGLFMLIALVLLLCYWNPAIRRLAAVLAGVGFGAFIDELGKFITHDNDYFFQPTIALLYVIFVLMFFLARSIQKSVQFTENEIRVNEELRKYFEESRNSLGSRVRVYFELREWIDNRYKRIVANRWFSLALIGGFVIFGVSQFVFVVANIINLNFFKQSGEPRVFIIQAAASALSTGCVWVGIWQLRKSRLLAGIWFQRSVLVNIYLTQVFLFYNSQLAALSGLLLNILIYMSLRYMVSQEYLQESGKEVAGA